MLSPLLPKYDITGELAGTNKALVLGNTGNPYTGQVVSKGYRKITINPSWERQLMLKRNPSKVR